MRYKLVYYKYHCESEPAITLVEEENGVVFSDYPIACRNDPIHIAVKNLKSITERLPLEEKITLFFKLLELLNYETTYTELSHLLEYYLL